MRVFAGVLRDRLGRRASTFEAARQLALATLQEVRDEKCAFLMCGGKCACLDQVSVEDWMARMERERDTYLDVTGHLDTVYM